MRQRLLNTLRHLKHSSRGRAWKVIRSAGIAVVAQYGGNRILSGPFMNLRLDRRSLFSAPAAKLLGTYEKELHDYIRQVCDLKFASVINIGAAEGYYAAGFAWMFNKTKVIAYEADEHRCDFVRHHGEINGLMDRIDVRQRCTEQELLNDLKDKKTSLLIIDIEGDELILLSRNVLRAARHSILIVETHDFKIPGCTSEIAERLRHTHQLEIIEARPRQSGDWPVAIPAPSSIQHVLMSEGRPEGMKWIFAKPFAH